MNNLSIGQRIRSLRKEKKLTLAEIAGEKFTKGYISQIELGKVNPSFKLLSHIASKLEISVEDLLSLDSKLEYQLAAIESEFACKRYEQVAHLCKDISQGIENPTTAKIKLVQAKAFYYLNRFEDCIALTRAILDLNDEWSTNYRLEAYSFLAISLFTQESYSYLEIIKLYDEAFEFAAANNLSHSKLLANMYLNKATAFQNLERFEEAIETYNETLDFARAHDCTETVLDAFIRLSFCHYKTGNLETAKKFVYDGLSINRILELRLPQAEALLILSYIMLAEENYRAVETLVKKALPLFEEVNRVQGTVESLSVLAKTYKETEQSELGMDQLLKCVEIIESNEFNIFENSLLKEIANACMAFGLHENASIILSKLVNY